MNIVVAEPTQAVVRNYYDARVDEKLSDFIYRLPRIEVAIETLAEWAPSNPRRILELGCGIGATSWRMARAWPKAEVIGIDPSTASIEVAKTCFQLPNLIYYAGFLNEWDFEQEFDLIVLMDVYEHIPPSDREVLHASLRRLLSRESRLILMMPTPAHQDFLRRHHPGGLQPVDEHIYPQQIIMLADHVDARLLYYREVGVWHYGDYFHVVLGRGEKLPAVTLRQPKREGLAAIRELVKQFFGCAVPIVSGRSDYLGRDLLNPRVADHASRLQVSTAERRRLAAAWQNSGSLPKVR